MRVAWPASVRRSASSSACASRGARLARPEAGWLPTESRTAISTMVSGIPALSRVADQGWHDGLRVGDDGEVGALDHFGVEIGVDGNDVFYLRDALQVLGRSRDPQREVTPRGHQSARSADLAV